MASPRMITTPRKTGILLTAFGASSLKGQKALSLFDQEVRSSFPGIPVRWAFTSAHMRTRLTESGKKTDSVHKAVMRMAYERYTHIAVQPLHMIPGLEYENMLAEVARASEEHPVVTAVGAPLLTDETDISSAAQAFFYHIPPQRQPDQAVVCMGHGTWHKGAGSYEYFAAALQQNDPGVFVGTLEGERNIASILPEILAFGATEAWLLPLLAVTGKHAEKDMAGDASCSWKSCLEAAGVRCLPLLNGTVEYRLFRKIWLEHLATALEKLKTI